MTFSYQYVCVRCAKPQDWGTICYLCPLCGHNLRIERATSVDDEQPSAADIVASLSGTGLWRYAPLLPISSRWASRLAVGDTPLLSLGADDGVHLWVKDDSRNPSGSLKDRATELVLAAARWLGCTQVVTASTGNAGASLACIAASQKMPATVVVPRHTPYAKLAQIRAYGAQVQVIDGTYDHAFDVAISMADAPDVCCRNTGFNPFTREGKKTCAFEIAEALGWDVPDWVVVPTGDGNILSGIATGFLDLHALGITSRMPRLLAAQARSSHSIAHDWLMSGVSGALPSSPTPVRPNTLADSLSVSRPRDHLAALQALRMTQGECVVVTDAQIMASSQILSQRYGLWFEPSAAAGHAALSDAIACGRIEPGARVVLLGTGSGLKDPHACARVACDMEAAATDLGAFAPSICPGDMIDVPMRSRP
ncbi:threonine synthase [Pandoraea norimbergensis]|uniref:threonine synthase n=1 Tax=Pandoraea norimbergensis TaxID=93219 RepID=UPI000A022D52|nr:pyridoxal-phosphate dependent enzyme [Pandoraea norimbergensis]